MADMYGNYDAKQEIEFDERRAAFALTVGFTKELEDRGMPDPMFGTASVIYLRQAYGPEALKAAISDSTVYNLAFNLCAVVAGKNTDDAEAFSDLVADLYKIAKEHPEMMETHNETDEELRGDDVLHWGEDA